jgi:alpha-tubulin suppressor-like RCC1 family protein
VYCSGANTTGQLGNATTTSSTTFVQVPGLTGVVQVVAGQDHTCARRGDGSVVCWGDNDFAQLGDGTLITRVTPVAVTPW